MRQHAKILTEIDIDLWQFLQLRFVAAWSSYSKENLAKSSSFAITRPETCARWCKRSYAILKLETRLSTGSVQQIRLSVPAWSSTRWSIFTLTARTTTS